MYLFRFVYKAKTTKFFWNFIRPRRLNPEYVKSENKKQKKKEEKEKKTHTNVELEAFTDLIVRITKGPLPSFQLVRLSLGKTLWLMDLFFRDSSSKRICSWIAQLSLCSALYTHGIQLKRNQYQFLCVYILYIRLYLSLSLHISKKQTKIEKTTSIKFRRIVVGSPFSIRRSDVHIFFFISLVAAFQL